MKRLTLGLSIFCSLLMIGAIKAQAAPDIAVKNMSGSGTFVAGQPVTFTYDVANQSADGMNATNSYNLIKVGEVLSGPYEGVNISGNYAYTNGIGLASSPYSFGIFDISNPDTPFKVSSFENHTHGEAGSVISGNYEYVGHGACPNLEIWDISNKSNPALAGTSPGCVAPSFGGIAMNYPYVYMNQGSSGGIQIYNVSNPAAITLVGKAGSLLPNTAGRTVEYKGNYVFIGGSRWGTYTGGFIEVYDVSNPALPVSVKQITFADSFNSSTISGNYMYLGHYESGGTSIIDISNPLLINRVSVAINNGMSQIAPVVVGSYLYSGNEAFNISNPANPVMVNKRPLGLGYINIRSSAVSTNLSYMYGTTGSDGKLMAFEPHTLSRVCIDNPNCLISTTGIVGNNADAGLLSFSFRRTISTTWNTPTTGKHTAYFCSDVKDSYGFDGVAESNETNNCQSVTFTISATAAVVAPQAKPDITVRNMSITSGTTGSPILLAGQPVKFTYDVFNQGSDMDAFNSYRYTNTGRYFPPSSQQSAFYNDIALNNGNAYVSAGWSSKAANTVSVFDISSKTPVKLGGELNSSPIYYGINSVLNGNYIYVYTTKWTAGGGSWLGNYIRVYDVSDPSNPVLKNETKDTGSSSSFSMDIKGNHLYIQSFNYIEIYDISIADNPIFVKSYAIPRVGGDRVHKDEIVGNYYYLTRYSSAEGAKEFEIYDLTDPINPVKKGGLDFGDNTFGTGVMDAAIKGNYAFLIVMDVSMKYSFVVVDISDPSNLVKISTMVFQDIPGETLLINGDNAIIGGFGNRHIVLNIKDPNNPVIISKVSDAPSGTTEIQRMALFDNKKIIASEANAIGIYEPHTFSRVCIDNSDCLNVTSPVAPAKNLTDTDAGFLSQGFTSATSSIWNTTALDVGPHTAYFCSDVRDAKGYDGVAESDETNNCQAVPFRVFSSTPILKICQDSCSTGTLRGNSTTPGTLNLTKNEAYDYVACVGATANCDDPSSTADVTASSTWSDVPSNNAVTLSVNSNKERITGTGGGAEDVTVTYSGLTATTKATVTCVDTTRCDRDPVGDSTCVGQTFTSALTDNCGYKDYSCSGRKTCNISADKWREVAP